MVTQNIVIAFGAGVICCGLGILVGFVCWVWYVDSRAIKRERKFFEAWKKKYFGIALFILILSLSGGCSKNINIEKNFEQTAIDTVESFFEYDPNAVMYPDTPACNCPDLNFE